MIYVLKILIIISFKNCLCFLDYLIIKKCIQKKFIASDDKIY